jgi:hypothetical protein
MGPYNGYKGRERDRKAGARRRRRAEGLPAHPRGPCAICGDPTVTLEAHAEDYSLPYRWEPPAEYALCRTCHKNKLHKRFSNPSDWEAWKAHIRRGGRSSDLAKPHIAAELRAYKAALKKGTPFALRQLRPPVMTGFEWWERVRMDRRSLTDPKARARR